MHHACFPTIEMLAPAPGNQSTECSKRDQLEEESGRDWGCSSTEGKQANRQAKADAVGLPFLHERNLHSQFSSQANMR
jgi:hypothetical protein